MTTYADPRDVRIAPVDPELRARLRDTARADAPGRAGNRSRQRFAVKANQLLRIETGGLLTEPWAEATVIQFLDPVGVPDFYADPLLVDTLSRVIHGEAAAPRHPKRRA